MFKTVALFCALFALTFAVDPSWDGKWLVASSGSSSLYECDVPKAQTYANITEGKSGLELSANDLLDGSPTVWDLSWQSNQLEINNSCIGVLCVSANITVVKSVVTGVINWNVNNGSYVCRAVMVKVQDEESTYVDDLVSQVEKHIADLLFADEPVEESEQPWMQMIDEEISSILLSGKTVEVEVVIEPFRAAEPWLQFVNDNKFLF